MARRHRCPEPESGANFLLTYADLVTLLMAFFVLLFAMSTVDEAKFVVLLKGLEENFGNTTLQDGILDGGESIIGANLDGGSTVPVPGGSLVFEDRAAIVADEAEPADRPETDAGHDTDGDAGQQRGVTGSGSPPEESPADSPAADASDAAAPDLSRFMTADQLDAVRQRIEAVLVAEGMQDDVRFRFDERGLVIAIATDDVLFATGSARLSTASGGVLELIAPELAGFDNAIFVDGHTDDVPFGGTEYTNRDLSADRALAIARELELAFGLAADRLIPAGYGPFRPIGDNASTAGRAENRRVELVVAAGTLASPAQQTQIVGPGA